MIKTINLNDIVKNEKIEYCQTFVVLFLGVSLGYKIGLASVSLYLLEGILGLPVFSNSPEKGVGLIYFTGPTMGYLIGFLSASYLASKINKYSNFSVPDAERIISLGFIVSKYSATEVVFLSVVSSNFTPLFSQYLTEVPVETNLYSGCCTSLFFHFLNRG